MLIPSDLQDKHPNVWYKVLVLIHDLRNFATDYNARARLEAVVDASYISLPYFQDDECTLMKECLVTNTTTTTTETLAAAIESFLAQLVQKRVASGDFRPCAAHDLAPLFESLLGVTKEDIKNERFLARLARSGLGDSSDSKDVRKQKGGAVNQNKRKAPKEKR
jgi:hypothetical protein